MMRIIAQRRELTGLNDGLRRPGCGTRGCSDPFEHTATKTNPVARSNVCPEMNPPAEPCFHAFSFTVPGRDEAPTFVVAGSGEAREGGASYRERTVRWGETSP